MTNYRYYLNVGASVIACSAAAALIATAARRIPSYHGYGSSPYERAVYQQRPCAHVFYDHQGSNETSHEQQHWIVTQTAEDMTCSGQQHFQSGADLYIRNPFVTSIYPVEPRPEPQRRRYVVVRTTRTIYER